jgi:serpin B
MKKLFSFTILIVLCFIFFCSQQSPDSSKSQILIDANQKFAFKLYHSMKTSDKNLFFSPFSISNTLAMLYTGARKQTAKQMKEAIFDNNKGNDIPLSIKKLNDELMISTTDSSSGEKIEMIMANGVWGRTGSKLENDFINILQENFNSTPEFLDFSNQPDSATIKINKWVSDKTKGKIENIISPDIITPQTNLVLSGTVYFDAKWLKKFFTVDTSDESFTLIDGSKVTVPMMKRGNAEFNNMVGNKFRVFEMLYKARDYSMIVILPDSGYFKEIESSLSPEFLKSVVDSLAAMDIKYGMIRIKLPKFIYTSTSIELNDILYSMGMKDAFTSNANFSGIYKSEKSIVSHVLHKAFVAVNETGTIAAAATEAIEFTGRPPDDERYSFYCDRPFIYLIYNKKINTILFIGRMMNPKEGS